MKIRSLRLTTSILLITALMTAVTCSDSAAVLGSEQPSSAPAESLRYRSESLYSQVLERWRNNGYNDVQQAKVSLPAVQFSNASDGVSVQSNPISGKSNVLQLNERAWVEYTFDMQREGLYNLSLEYIPLQDSNIPIQISVLIDGKLPFAEARNVKLERVWKDKRFPAEKNDQGNEIRPPQVSAAQWMEKPLMDSVNTVDEPLRWHLGSGKHTIRIESVYESIALSKVTASSPEAVESFEQVMRTWPKTDAPAKSDWYTVMEAEQMLDKSEPSVQVQASRDDLASPASNGKIVFNSMGGSRWNTGGQWAEWSFAVPEDGLYEIHLKYSQPFQKGVSTFRQIRIDGKAPFLEMLAYRFPYEAHWKSETLHDLSGTPYQFYLTKGQHTLKLVATYSPLAPIVESLQGFINEIQNLNRTVRLVTGVSGKDNMDMNRDWKMAEHIPDIKERLGLLKQSLEQNLQALKHVYGNNVNGASAIRSAIDTLDKLTAHPDDLPNKPLLFSTMQESLSSYLTGLTKQPLLLDQIYVSSATATLPDRSSSRWAVMKQSIKSFFLTFSSEYFDYGRSDRDAALTVWVNRGRDYVNLLQQMVDEQFTPSTGIKVNINLMPDPSLLLLSNAAGREPDIALGIGEGTPLDFAMRGAILNLNSFSDYAEAAEPFLPGAMIPFHYDHGDYALPETLSFNVMFYRTDILERLRLKVPETWDDVMEMLPSLHQNGFEFFYPPGNYTPLFLQNGVSFYTEGGLKSGLDTPEAFEAFKQWTDMFNIYGFPREVPNFYSHFRNGDMPVGIADFATYLQLLSAAPEISGSWSIAPIPGKKKADGTIERWTGGGLTAGMIFKSTKNPDKAWKFLKWWTSTETQTRYGNDVELFNGIEFRWNTANMNAFKRLPWPKEHLKQIMEQYKWFQEVPTVPGGYFTSRELVFAWNRTVLSNMNFRQSLENAGFEINRELLRKQREFGLIDDNGHIVRKLELPQLNKP